MKRSSKLTSSAVALLALVVAASAACSPAAEQSQPAAQASLPSTDANITRLTTNILETSQYAHRPFDDRLASTFLDRYLDSLDGTRSLFLQSDIDEFAAFRPTLAHVTRDTGDTTAAQVIFQRYLKRLGEENTFFAAALQAPSFDFSGHDVYSYDREKAQRPKDAAAAQELWRQQLRAEYLQEKLRDKKPEQIVSTLTKRHAQQLNTMTAMRSDEVLDIYLEALAHVYDPHSDYMGRQAMETFSIAMNLSLFGIGATLENADGYCKIRELVAGGPAARSGLLKPGDRIVAVAQAGKDPVDIVNMPLSHAVELIRGSKGSTVTLTVIPAGAADGSPTKTAAIVRDEVKLEDQEAKAKIVDLPVESGGTLRVGVIDLPSFYAGEGGKGRSATADVARLLTKLKAEKVQGVALDLRKNPGGSLNEAISLTGLFIQTGPVVQTRDQEGKIEVDSDKDPSVLYDGPLVVLTSRFSASASEIVVGALQDYGRAVVVGDSSTFGKGTVQSVLPLGRVMDHMHLAHTYDPGALKVTISKFYRPSGASTQLRGVASDIVLPSTSDISDVSESSMKDPLPWDTVPPASYAQQNRVAPYVVSLRAKSAARVSSEKEFQYLATDVAQLKKVISTKSVSLNEAERREELARSKTRHEEREREAHAILNKIPQTYEVTLKNVATPGLPAPIDAAAPKPEKAASANDSDDISMARSDDDTILGEGEKILADYVQLSAASVEGH